MLVFRLGWRNLWRNRRRSVLTVGSIAVAFATLVVVVGLVEGVARQLLANGTRTMLGQIQVHAGTYLPDRSIHDTIGAVAGANVETLITRIESLADAHATPRVFGFALLSTGQRSAGAQLVGIDPAREARVSTLQQALVRGTGLAGGLADAAPMPVVLGQLLADELGAEVGAEVAVVTQAADGSMGNELLRVVGILRTGMMTADRSLALMQIADVQTLLALPAARIHEVAVSIADIEAAHSGAAHLSESIREPADLRIQSWRTLAPQIGDYLALTRSSNWMMFLIVGTFAAFGVLNTMLMAVFERTHELGVLAAMGLRPLQIMTTIVAESVCLALVGLAGGLGLGALGMWYFGYFGWDLTRWTEGVTIAGVLFDPVLRSAWDWPATAQAALTLAVVTVVPGMIPAVRAPTRTTLERHPAPRV